MRTLVFSALALAALAVSGAALASDCDLSCPNQCPLAQSANALRSNGSEGVCSPVAVGRDVRREVLACLEQV